jgi:hypothetical protein
MKTIAAMLVLLFGLPTVFRSSASPSSPDQPPGPPVNVSMIQLIATPERFDGKLISVVGFLGVDPEDARLYVSEEDYKRYIPGNGVWIDENKQMQRDIEQIDLHYVTIVGVFKQKGLPRHMAVGGGDSGISDIRQCLPWLTPMERHAREPK